MIKLTKEQFQVVEKVLNRYNGDRARAAMGYAPCREVSIELFTRCMIEGYEQEKTKEDQVLALFHQYPRQGVAHNIIRRMLVIVDMKVKGIND